MKWTYGNAIFSECGTFRYTLVRLLSHRDIAKQVVFIGLNPSTADAEQDDPTIRRCIGFAKRWEFNELMMLNVFAFRATDPKIMKAACDPIGCENNYYLSRCTSRADLVVAAWGANCPERRERQVVNIIKRPIYCLGKTKAGRPRHPLYLKKTTKLQLFTTDSLF